jgi:hypothetical protein
MAMLQTVGTTTCPVCETVQRVFRHSRAVPGQPLAISVHFLPGGAQCRGTGRRVARADVTPLEAQP